ncbi:MAG: hypothetical protein AB4426_30010 [Xenococcaceae cyanobacterium]
MTEVIQIPVAVYENIVSHLKVHESTDGWAKCCLQQLQFIAKPVRIGRTASCSTALHDINVGLKGRLV